MVSNESQYPFLSAALRSETAFDASYGNAKTIVGTGPSMPEIQSRSDAKLANEAARELAHRSIPGALAYLILLVVPISATSYARDYPRSFLATAALILLFATARLVFAWWLAQQRDSSPGWRWWGFLIGTYGWC